MKDVSKVLEIVETARATGKIRKGVNEVTKSIERGEAKLVVFAEDVSPPEIVMHLPPLCEEKKIPFVYISKQNDIGAASGLEVGSTAAAIVKPGKAKDLIDEVAKQISDMRA